jgi:hypothetical protein
VCAEEAERFLIESLELAAWCPARPRAALDGVELRACLRPIVRGRQPAGVVAETGRAVNQERSSVSHRSNCSPAEARSAVSSSAPIS